MNESGFPGRIAGLDPAEEPGSHDLLTASASPEKTALMTFRICTIGTSAGAIGLCPLPGRFSPLADDLAAIAAWHPSIVISLTEAAEMAANGADGLGEALADKGIAWAHFPVRDFSIPTEERLEDWAALSRQLHAFIGQRGRVLLHCFGGQGRSGMIALRLLVERGEAADAALQRIRAVRPGAIETEAQYRWAAAGQKI
jgi:protein-tyrosine phosphatase